MGRGRHQSFRPKSRCTRDKAEKSHLSIALVLLIAVVGTSLGCTASGPQSGAKLPSYAKKQADGSVQIDLAAASDGKAKFNAASRAIQYDGAGYETTFQFGGMSGTTSVGRTLNAIPAKISPTLTPNDGVADLFVTTREEDDGRDLHVTVFLDSDWNDLVSGNVSIDTAEYGSAFRPLGTPQGLVQQVPTIQEGYPVEKTYPVDFANAADGIWHQDFVFAQSDNPAEWKSSPIIVITNIAGGYSGFMRAVNNLETKPGDFAVTLNGK